MKSSKVLDEAADFVVVADEEKFQRAGVFAEEQAGFQAGATFKNIFSQPPDGDAGVRVRMAEAVGDGLERGFNAGEIRVAQIFQQREESRA
jgi:hypothetical protein